MSRALRSGPRLLPWIAAALVWTAPALAQQKNGFDVAGAQVPVDEILEGGPPRDGIHSVDEPVFVAREAASWVAPNNPVLGVAVGEEAHSYPVHLIEHHQVVNDRFPAGDGGTPVVVTYDPLAGTPRAHLRTVDGRTLEFGVSGLIYNHNFLLYDRQTQSLWVQYTGEAISGPLAGKRLSPLVVRQEAEAVWNERYPRSRVLARPIPEHIDYRMSPFLRYIVDDALLFPVKAEDRSYHLKEVVLGVVVDGRSRAYLGSQLTAAGGSVEDEFQGHRIRLSYDPGEAVFGFDVPDAVQVEEAYWLSFKAFHPDTEVWKAPVVDAP